MSRLHPRPRVRGPAAALPRVLPALFCLLLAACGAAGEDLLPGSAVDSSAAPSVLTITTQSLPDGRAGAAYPPAQITTSGAEGEVEVELVAGALPPGLALASDGRLLGTPTQSGCFAFSVRAEDGTDAAQRDLAIAVDHVGIVVESGLRHGCAWSGHDVLLRVTGAAGDVRFEIADAQSGGRILSTNGPEAVYRPGTTPGRIVTDVLRAHLEGQEVSCELALRVAPDPYEHHFARFGSTDVWVLDLDKKHGAHPYATDLHAALAHLGLRRTDSTDREGTRADRLAEEACRALLLRELCPMFLRLPDGSAGPDGLPISFDLEMPGDGYERPAPAHWLPGAPNRYSVMAFVDGSRWGIVGTAITDSARNALHVHDAPLGDEELGVFVNRIAESVGLVYSPSGGNPLLDRPVGEEDVEVLEALLYGLPSSGTRAQDVRSMLEGFARSLAAVAAHEIGHSLGLSHTNPTTYGSLMNSGAAIHPLAECAFLPEDLAQLRSALPGPGRAGAPATSGVPTGIAAQAMPAGGIDVCRRGECGGRPGR